MHLPRAITLLHISDTQFGRNHRFGRLGLPDPDAPFDTLFARLRDDVEYLKDKHELAPDLLIASGDLAEVGKRTEFDDVLDFLTRLTDVLGLARERAVIVPGNHDINRISCQAYFLDCASNEETPVAPYWRKWERFHRMFRAFYGDAASIRQPGAQVTRVQAEGIEYLRVAESDGAHCHLYPVGVADHGLTADYLAHFRAEVHRPYRGADPGVTSRIVYPATDRPPQTLIDEAGRHGVRVMSLIEYQGLIDFGPYLERQTRRLEHDPIYPPSLYVHQRMGCEVGWDRSDSEDALATVMDWLARPEPRFVLLLGDFGTGKSFLLHMLALRLAARGESPTPVLIEMRGLQKARTLDELVAQHLSGAGETRIDLDAFRYMLAHGRIALLFDGFDELALRVTYERAAEHFDTLIEAAAGQAKIVMTSRTQHFESEHQIKSALAARAQHIPGRRIGRLAGFGKTEIRRFLVNRLPWLNARSGARLSRRLHESIS